MNNASGAGGGAGGRGAGLVPPAAVVYEARRERPLARPTAHGRRPVPSGPPGIAPGRALHSFRTDPPEINASALDLVTSSNDVFIRGVENRNWPSTRRVWRCTAARCTRSRWACPTVCSARRCASSTSTSCRARRRATTGRSWRASSACRRRTSCAPASSAPSTSCTTRKSRTRRSLFLSISCLVFLSAGAAS